MRKVPEQPTAFAAVDWGMGDSWRQFKRVGKWVGLALVVLVLGVDAVSCRYQAIVREPAGRAWDVSNGKLLIAWQTYYTRHPDNQ